MDPGELNRFGKIRVWADQPNMALSLTPTYDAGLDRWMKVDPIRGLEIRAGAQTGENPTHLIWVRYCPQVQAELITRTHVVEVLGRRFRVLDAINVDDAREWVRMTVKDIGAL